MTFLKRAKSLLKDFKNILNLKKALKDEEIAFRLISTLKITGLSLFIFIISWFFIMIILDINLLFFRANGFENVPVFENLYYEFVIQQAFELIPLIGIYIIVLLFVGLYVSDLLIRPFRIIGDYCDRFLEGKKPAYDPGFFSDLKLLSHFSEWFFNAVETFYINDKTVKLELPKKFTRIHRPVFETSFFLHYSILIIITSICTSFFVHSISLDIYSGVIDLAHKALPSTDTISVFLNGQIEHFKKLQIVTIILNFLLSIFLIFHFYAKVAGASFGFFATMRSFVKGNHDSRVHLLGYYYIRVHSRKLNKYLEKVKTDFEGK